MKDKLPNYLEKIKKLKDSGQLPKGVGVVHLNVFHDDWCPALKGGICTCDPDVELRKDKTQ